MTSAKNILYLPARTQITQDNVYVYVDVVFHLHLKHKIRIIVQSHFYQALWMVNCPERLMILALIECRKRSVGPHLASFLASSN